MKDRFSLHASQYAAFRPVYPPALYDFILRHTLGRSAAWDCACGNGQVARALAPHFTSVFATDISQKQLDSAFVAANVYFSIAPAESTSFADKSFDLITAGQAMHWFRIPEFFNEARRVGKEGSTIAYWGYSLFRINKQIDRIVDDFYVNVVGPYWDAERKLIDDHYRTIEFPFTRIDTPEFDFAFEWSLDELTGYITTWSSVQRMIRESGTSPIGFLGELLAPHWTTSRLRVTFPLFLTMGKI